jgi:hypothetical protein
VGVRLIVDVANVVGSRPDGWWRDRVGAADRLLRALTGLAGAVVTGPAGDGPVRIDEVVAVLEGAARPAAAPPGVEVVRAVRDGDTEVVAQAAAALSGGSLPLVVTADRGLRDRLPDGAAVAGPGWLNGLLGR